MQIRFAGKIVAETKTALRILETSHPPVYYFPVEAVDQRFLFRGIGRSFCEFKGLATYWDIRVGKREAVSAAWSYARPAKAFEELAGMLAFYPGKADACFVDGERVEAQPGDFYGGWITSHVAAPFKAGGGSLGW